MNKTKKYKILMLLSTFGVASGVNSFAMNYLRHVDHDKVQIDFAVYFERESPYIDEIHKYGGNTFLLPPVQCFKKHIKACNEIIDSGNYDVIHDNSLILTIPFMLVAKRKRVPLRILHSHSTELADSRMKKVRNKLMLPILKWTATDYAACSSAAGKAMFKNRQYKIIPNVITPSKYIFDENERKFIRHKMGVEGIFVVATVGRAAYQKNPFFAMDVFKLLLTKISNVVFWWIGNGPLEKEMLIYADQLGISDKVFFLGKREDVIELYQAMDCFFLPSLFEGLPLTGIEAQAMGLPMVVSDTVTTEMVYTDLVEFVNLKGPIETWVKSLENALNRNINRMDYNTYLKNSHFSDANCGERLIKLYDQLLNNQEEIYREN